MVRGSSVPSVEGLVCLKGNSRTKISWALCRDYHLSGGVFITRKMSIDDRTKIKRDMHPDTVRGGSFGVFKGEKERVSGLSLWLHI